MSRLISDQIKFSIVENTYKHETYEIIGELVKNRFKKNIQRNNNKNYQ